MVDILRMRGVVAVWPVSLDILRWLYDSTSYNLHLFRNLKVK